MSIDEIENERLSSVIEILLDSNSTRDHVLIALGRSDSEVDLFNEIQKEFQVVMKTMKIAIKYIDMCRETPRLKH